MVATQSIAAQTEFERVVLIDDPVRCRKLLSGGGFFRGYVEGTLRVVDGGLVWEGRDRIVDLPDVRSVEVFRDGFLRVDHEGPAGPATVVLQNRGRGLRQLLAATEELAGQLREAFGLAGPTPQAVALATAVREEQHADASRRVGRFRIVLGSVIAGVGLVATLVSYANADGAGFTLFWGAIVVGALFVLAGVVERVAAGRGRRSTDPTGPGFGSPVATGPPVTTGPPGQLGGASPRAEDPAPVSTAPEPPPAPAPPPGPEAPVAGEGAVAAEAADAPSEPSAAGPPPSDPSPVDRSSTRTVSRSWPSDVPTTAAWTVPAPAGAPAVRPATGPRWRWPLLAGVAGAVALVAVLVLVVVLVRGGDDGAPVATDSPTLTTEATEPADEPATPTTEGPAVAGGDAVQTAAGVLVVADVQAADRYPVGCAEADPSCIVADGDRLVVVTFQTPPGQSGMTVIDLLATEVFESELEEPSGTRIPAVVVMAVEDASTLDVVYGEASVESPSSLVLHWPGNDPISLS